VIRTRTYYQLMNLKKRVFHQ